MFLSSCIERRWNIQIVTNGELERMWKERVILLSSYVEELWKISYNLSEDSRSCGQVSKRVRDANYSWLYCGNQQGNYLLQLNWIYAVTLLKVTWNWKKRQYMFQVQQFTIPDCNTTSISAAVPTFYFLILSKFSIRSYVTIGEVARQNLRHQVHFAWDDYYCDVHKSTCNCSGGLSKIFRDLIWWKY